MVMSLWVKLGVCLLVLIDFIILIVELSNVNNVSVRVFFIFNVFLCVVRVLLCRRQ